jgi:hypothetical protein
MLPTRRADAVQCMAVVFSLLIVLLADNASKASLRAEACADP